jgi:hypothetical protein
MLELERDWGEESEVVGFKWISDFRPCGWLLPGLEKALMVNGRLGLLQLLTPGF